jgi:phosphoglycolate phosphatase
VTCFLFDIDGTLLLSGGAGRVAMQNVMRELFGIQELHRLAVHGRTDRAIIGDLFAAHNLPLDPGTYQEFSARYHDELRKCISGCGGRLLNGVSTLLNELAKVPAVAMGLLTGNSPQAAATKVEYFGIDSHFQFGGYGNVHLCRSDVAREALLDCRRWAMPRTVREQDVWVVGDTVHDIRCARAIGAKVIGVSTGGNSRQELENERPDRILDDLGQIDVFLALCNSVKRG